MTVGAESRASCVFVHAVKLISEAKSKVGMPCRDMTNREQSSGVVGFKATRSGR
jgi:hypothetical protein